MNRFTVKMYEWIHLNHTSDDHNDDEGDGVDAFALALDDFRWFTAKPIIDLKYIKNNKRQNYAEHTHTHTFNGQTEHFTPLHLYICSTFQTYSFRRASHLMNRFFFFFWFVLFLSAVSPSRCFYLKIKTCLALFL